MSKGFLFEEETSALLCVLLGALYLLCPFLPLKSLLLFPWDRSGEKEQQDLHDMRIDSSGNGANNSSGFYTLQRGRVKNPSSRMDPLTISGHIPQNLVQDTSTIAVEKKNKKEKEKLIKQDQRLPMNKLSSVGDDETNKRSSRNNNYDDDNNNSKEDQTREEPTDEDGVPLSILPVMNKCSINGPEFKELKENVPGQSIGTYVRFLVARQGRVKDSSEMLKNHLKWHDENFPFTKLPVERRQAIVRALDTGICFPYGRAKDGTPVMVFRGAFYNGAVAEPDDYALAFAFAIEETLRGSGQSAITVLANARHAEGATNAPADIKFVKKLITTLSANFPERLRKTILFPMPWYARIMKSAVSVFMDPRSMAKIAFSGHDVNDRAPEALECIDFSEMPEIVGGTCKNPMPSLADRARAILEG